MPFLSNATKEKPNPMIDVTSIEADRLREACILAEAESRQGCQCWVYRMRNGKYLHSRNSPHMIAGEKFAEFANGSTIYLKQIRRQTNG
jgi:hypothetical protein